MDELSMKAIEKDTLLVARQVLEPICFTKTGYNDRALAKEGVGTTSRIVAGLIFVPFEKRPRRI